MTVKNFPLFSNIPIQSVSNDGKFYRFSDLQPSESGILAPLDGYVYMYVNKVWGESPIQIQPGIPAFDYSFDTLETANWHLAFIPKRLTQLNDGTGRHMPASTHLIFNSPNFVIPIEGTKPRPLIANEIAGQLLSNYERKYPEHSHLGLFRQDEERHWIARFNLRQSMRDRHFVDSFWGQAENIPVLLPVKKGDVIWSTPDGEGLDVTIALVNHRYGHSVSSSHVYPTYYYDLNSYFQLLINRVQLDNISNVAYERELSSRAENRRNASFSINVVAHNEPPRAGEPLEHNFLEVGGGMQNVVMSFRTWNFDKQIEIPRDICSVGINEISDSRAFAELRTLVDDIRLVHLINGNSVQNFLIGPDTLSSMEQDYGELDIRMRQNHQPPTSYIHISLPYVDSVLDSLEQLCVRGMNLYSEYISWLASESSIDRASTNAELLPLFSKIDSILSNRRISRDIRESIKEQLEGGGLYNSRFQVFKRDVNGDDGYLTKIESITSEILTIIEDTALFNSLIDEFIFVENSSNEQLLALETKHEKFEFILDTLTLLEGENTSQALAKLTEHYFSQQDDIPLSEARGLTASHAMKIFKYTNKLARTISKVSTMHIKYDITASSVSLVNGERALRQYTNIVEGFDLRFWEPNTQHRAFRNIIEEGSERATAQTVVLNMFDVLAAWVSVGEKFYYGYTEGTTVRGVAEIGLSLTSAIGKTSQLPWFSQKTLEILSRANLSSSVSASIPRVVTGCSVLSAGLSFYSLTQNIREARLDNNSRNAFYNEVAAYGTLSLAMGEYLSFWLLSGIFSTGLIIFGVGFLIFGVIGSIATNRSEIESILRSCFFGREWESPAPRYRRFSNSVNYQISTLNSVLFPINHTRFTITRGSLSFNVTPTIMHNNSRILLAFYDERNRVLDSIMFDIGDENPQVLFDGNLTLNFSVGSEGDYTEVSISLSNYSRTSEDGPPIFLEVNDIETILFVVSHVAVDSSGLSQQEFAYDFPSTSRTLITG